MDGESRFTPSPAIFSTDLRMGVVKNMARMR